MSTRFLGPGKIIIEKYGLSAEKEYESFKSILKEIDGKPYELTAYVLYFVIKTIIDNSNEKDKVWFLESMSINIDRLLLNTKGKENVN